MTRRRSFRPQVAALEDRCVPAIFTVNAPGDVVDPGDGVLTLREAIAQANSASGVDIIKFDMTALPDEPFSTQSFIRLAGTQLTIADELLIEGPGRDELSISGEDLSRVFEVLPGVKFTLRDVTVESGQVADGDGGAILSHGILTVDASRFLGNAASGQGGAIANDVGASLNVNLCDFAGNLADSGGAISFFGEVTVGFSNFDANRAILLGGALAGNGQLTITHSLLANNRAGLGGALYVVGNSDTFLHHTTISGNRADGSGAPNFSGGGGIFSSNRLTIQHSTITGNRLSDGIGNGIDGGRFTGSSLSLLNTIVAGNLHDAGNPADISGTAAADSSFNLVGQGGGLTNGVGGNQVGVSDPKLTPLVDHGGPTRVHALLPDSPALDAGTAAAGATDQRGLPRRFGPAIDIGAYELQTLSLVVDSKPDISNNTFRAGDLSLREAIELSNKNPGEDSIQIALLGNIVLLGEELRLDDDVTITGPGAGQLTINANGGSRVFSVSAGVTAELSGLTMRGGWSDGRGGGLLNAGLLTLRDSVVTGNTANAGAGIANELGATLTVEAVQIIANSATFIGGGADNRGTLIMNAGVISGNSALHGGGLYNDDVATLTVAGSTIADNRAAGADGDGGSGGGIRNDGALTLTHTTLAGNLTGGDGGAIFTFGTLSVSHSTISGNAARNDGGGVMSGATLIFQHNTLTANRADADDSGLGRGAGLRVFQGAALLHHTILAGNLRGSGSTPDDADGQVLADSSFNLIGAGALGVTDATNGNQVGDVANPIDPRLGPLQDNGGPTLTHVPLPGSPAIDAGDPNLDPVPKNDQRGPGFARLVGDRIDIGAVEAPRAYVVTLAAGALSVLATDADDTLTIRRNGSDLIFSDPATIFVSEAGTVAADMHVVAVPLASITAGLTIDLDDGDDEVIFDWLAGGAATIAGGVSVEGGSGLDAMFVHGDDSIAGVVTTGAEAISGILGLADVVYAFSGIDAQEMSRLTALTFVAAGGDDVINIASATPGKSALLGTSGERVFANLTWSLIPAVVLSTAAGDAADTTDTVTVAAGGLAAAGMKFFTVVGGNGRDSLRIDPASFKLPVASVAGGAIRFNAGAGADTILSSGNSSFTLSNTRLAAKPGGNVGFIGVERAILVGGAGKNTLDAAAFKGSVVLDGGAGNDTLRGAKGRSILIGGRGRDALTGGPGEDFLVGGAVTHDALDAAFASIFDEWLRIDLNYNRRRMNLRTLALLTLATAPNDGVPDLLGGGPGRDWFWSFNRDKLPDRTAAERAR